MYLVLQLQQTSVSPSLPRQRPVTLLPPSTWGGPAGQPSLRHQTPDTCETSHLCLYMPHELQVRVQHFYPGSYTNGDWLCCGGSCSIYLCCVLFCFVVLYNLVLSCLVSYSVVLSHFMLFCVVLSPVALYHFVFLPWPRSEESAMTISHPFSWVCWGWGETSVTLSQCPSVRRSVAPRLL